MTDIVKGGFDAGVRFGKNLAQDAVAVPIGPPQRYAVVGSPAYLAAHGRPATPQDLATHPLHAPARARAAVLGAGPGDPLAVLPTAALRARCRYAASSTVRGSIRWSWTRPGVSGRRPEPPRAHQANSPLC